MKIFYLKLKNLLGKIYTSKFLLIIKVNKFRKGKLFFSLRSSFLKIFIFLNNRIKKLAQIKSNQIIFNFTFYLNSYKVNIIYTLKEH